ncbi:LytR family transcriptional regulator [Nocardioides sp. JQ2195]|uniref:LCP family protein n=1 Tax=Nocardioides sp. JQ2195 TaxID=2592334 RepID=UPI00143EB08D|nr:LCP family protein [Nocardioides sp. JQ2195]QIX27866.1 LytR family transcriptional regulator [Nocardioides sp. JQ2195]
MSIALMDSTTEQPAPRRRNDVKALGGMLVCLVVLFGISTAAIGTVLGLGGKLALPVQRIDGVFAGLEDRPSRPATGDAAEAVNILLMGVDRRSDVATTGDDAQAPEWIAGAQRTDTLMLLHIDGDRRGASIISLPRDSWVQVPGHGHAKINAAFSLAGPSLAVETIENLTNVRIDHLAVIDWEGFRQMTDEVGGVVVEVPETVHDSARDITWTAGTHVLNGQQALDYVGQRYGLPGGDLDRVRRQQAFLRAVLQANLHTAMRSDPFMLHHFLRTLARHASIDAEWSTIDMGRLAVSLRNLRSADIHYFTAPVSGLGREGAQSVVHLDHEAGAELWQAVRNDRVDDWAAAHPDAEAADVVD